MKAVLHDWTDEGCVQILRNCRQVMKPGGKLLLVEPIIQPGHNSESAANKFLDLQMLINSAGRERTAEEFAHLFETSGFKLTGVLSSSQTGFSILEGISV